MKTKHLPLLLVSLGLAVPAAAPGQEPPPPPNPDAAPVVVKLTTPKAVTKKGMKQGFDVRVQCTPACDARLSLTGSIGIIKQTSTQATPSGRTLVLKIQAFQVEALKKGSKLTLSVDARSAEDGVGSATRRIRVR